MSKEALIREAVASAIETNEVLWVAHEAEVIASRSGASADEIAHELTEAGLRARINMEIGDYAKEASRQRHSRGSSSF